MSDVDLAMLLDARAKAQRLLDEVRKVAADAEANPPPIPPDDLAAGKAAMTASVAAAERMLRSLEEAIQIALAEQDGLN